MNSELPFNWAPCLLEDVVELNMGQSPSGEATNDKGVGVPLIGGAADLTAGEAPHPTKYTTAPTKLCAAGDLIICIRATIGRTVVADREFCLGRGVAGLRVLQVERAWVQQFLTHIESYLAAQGTGSTFLTIGKETLSHLELPLPPQAEQKRIVAKIEELNSRSRRAREALAAVGPMLEQFRQSVLAAAFRGDLTADWRAAHPDTEPASALLARIRAERRLKWEEAELARMKVKGKTPTDDEWKSRYAEPEPIDDTDLPELPEGWCWAGLGEVVDVQLGQRRAPEYVGERMYPYLRSANITWRGLDLNDVKLMGFADAEPLKLQVGDVLMNEASGSPTEVGKPALWNGEIPHCCFQATVIRLRLYSTEINPLWVYFSRLRDALLGEYVARCPGLGIIHLTANLLRRWPVPMAPLEEINLLVEILPSLLNAVDSVQNKQTALRQQLEVLDQSVLAKAFRGELVPQNPSDEPASVLLERIRVARAAEATKKTDKNGRAKMQRGIPAAALDDSG